MCMELRPGILEYNHICRFVASMYHAITHLNDDDDDVCMGGPPLFVYSQFIIGFTYFLEKHYGKKKTL